MARFPYIGSGYLFLIQGGKVLLQRRANTGFEDGNYGVPAGHMDGNETAREACAREIQEEIGITIEPQDFTFAHFMHRKAAHDERFDIFWTVERFEGVPENREPEKCDDLSWFPLDALPDNMIGYVREAFEYWQAGIPYSEYGW